MRVRRGLRYLQELLIFTSQLVNLKINLIIQDDFLSLLRSLSTLMFPDIIPISSPEPPFLLVTWSALKNPMPTRLLFNFKRTQQ